MTPTCLTHPGLSDGLLLPSELGRPTSGVLGRARDADGQQSHAGANLEARHTLLQRQALLPAHGHLPQQVHQDQPGWTHSVLNEVLILKQVDVTSM